MPLNDLHRRVATIALRAANRHGFALAATDVIRFDTRSRSAAATP